MSNHNNEMLVSRTTAILFGNGEGSSPLSDTTVMGTTTTTPSSTTTTTNTQQFTTTNSSSSSSHFDDPDTATAAVFPPLHHYFNSNNNMYHDSSILLPRKKITTTNIQHNANYYDNPNYHYRSTGKDCSHQERTMGNGSTNNTAVITTSTKTSATNDDDNHHHHHNHDEFYYYYYDDDDNYPTTTTTKHHHHNNKINKSIVWYQQIRSYVFGFMYEEMELEDSIDHYRSRNKSRSFHNNNNNNHSWTTHPSSLSFWRVLFPLSTTLILQSMSTSMIYTILSYIGTESHLLTVGGDTATSIIHNNLTTTTNNSTNYNILPSMVTISLMGTAFGKFMNGPIVDIYGARRTTLLATGLLCFILFTLANLPIIVGTNSTFWMLTILIFMMEFVSSVQWPCTIVILATHYRSSSRTTDLVVEQEEEDDEEGMGVTTTGNAKMTSSFSLEVMKSSRNSTSTNESNSSWYESGVFITSLSSRIGSMMGILLSSYLMSLQQYQIHWRTIVYLSTYITTIATSIIYLYIWDTPQYKHSPQNPIDPNLYRQWFPEQVLQNHRNWSINRRLRLLMFIIQTNVFPSVRHILGSSTFWIVTLSHTGTSMVRTSPRWLGSYFIKTSDGTLSYEQAVSQSIWYNIGTVMGLFIAGTIFTKGCRNDRQRKYMIFRLYVITILACYVLSIMAIPRLRQIIQAPELIRIIQIMAVTTIGFGVAVQLYHIPSLVGATFGCDKGLFVSYNDGVAYIFVAIAWRYVVGHTTMQERSKSNDNGYDDDTSGGIGWAYGWAAVALLLIISTFLMVEFMEHYFCRPKYGMRGDGYETIIFS